MARICWHAGRFADLDKLVASGYRGEDLRLALSEKWGAPVSPVALKTARRRRVGLAHRPTDADTIPNRTSGPHLLVRDSSTGETPIGDIAGGSPHDDITEEWEPVHPDVSQQPNKQPAAMVLGEASDRHLLISDLQIPFEHPNALRFCLAVQKEYRIPGDNVLCVGDETDVYFGSMFAKDPDASHTPLSELAVSIERLKRWYAAFPIMRICNSNHGDRWLKKATEAQIPSQLLRAYREIIQAPEGWRWADRWPIDIKHPFDVEHGHHGAQGIFAHRTKAIDNGRSIVHGHLHASAGISYVRNSAGRGLWGMNCGSLIDAEAYAFHYARAARFKPWIGVGVVINNGSTPILVPYGSL